MGQYLYLLISVLTTFPSLMLLDSSFKRFNTIADEQIRAWEIEYYQRFCGLKAASLKNLMDVERYLLTHWPDSRNDITEAGIQIRDLFKDYLEIHYVNKEYNNCDHLDSSNKIQVYIQSNRKNWHQYPNWFFRFVKKE